MLARLPSLLVTRYSLLVLLVLAGCGGDFVTSTPAYARYSSGAVFKEFKAKGLRVDGVQDMPKDAFGADTPPYKEAKGFLGGASGTATATLFTFDTPGDLSAMADHIKKRYATKQRQVTAHNVLLVFWLPSKDDTLAYDSALLALP